MSFEAYFYNKAKTELSFSVTSDLNVFINDVMMFNVIDDKYMSGYKLNPNSSVSPAVLRIANIFKDRILKMEKTDLNRNPILVNNDDFIRFIYTKIVYYFVSMYHISKLSRTLLVANLLKTILELDIDYFCNVCSKLNLELTCQLIIVKTDTDNSSVTSDSNVPLEKLNVPFYSTDVIYINELVDIYSDRSLYFGPIINFSKIFNSNFYC